MTSSNQALPFTEATECEIAAVLWGLTKLKILGDFTQLAALQTLSNLYSASSQCAFGGSWDSTLCLEQAA